MLVPLKAERRRGEGKRQLMTRMNRKRPPLVYFDFFDKKKSPHFSTELGAEVRQRRRGKGFLIFEPQK